MHLVFDESTAKGRSRAAPIPCLAKDPHSRPADLRGEPGEPGVASSESHDFAEPVAPPDLRRRLPVWTSARGPAGEAAGPSWHGQTEPPARGVPGVDPGSAPGLHHVGTIRGEAGSPRSQSCQARPPGHATSGDFAAGRPAPVRALRAKDARRLYRGGWSALWLYYRCTRGSGDYAEPQCQCLAGSVLDGFIREQILAAVAPAALEASLAAVAEVARERSELSRQWRLRLERARYDAERAARQYQACEPENRLVGRELERRWEESLKLQGQVELEYERWQRLASAVSPTTSAIWSLAV